MYSGKNLVYLLTILEAIEKIWIYANDFQDAETFYQANEQMNFNACQTLLLAIAEESKKIEPDLKAAQPEIPWEQIAGLRNRLAHDYRGTNPEISFEIIRAYLAPLKTALVEMLHQIEYENQALLNALDSPYYKHLSYLRKE